MAKRPETDKITHFLSSDLFTCTQVLTSENSRKRNDMIKIPLNKLPWILQLQPSKAKADHECLIDFQDFHHLI